MSPALKAMVEAMEVEMRRQLKAGEASLVFLDDALPGDPTAVELESFDLEKVARAGLAALRSTDTDWALITRVDAILTAEPPP